jgi:protein-S-isoprenylcysteine O-methyltransferase Ste14
MAKSNAPVLPATQLRVLKSVSAGNLTGAVLMMVLLPPVTYYMWNCVVQFGGALVSPVTLLGRIPAPTALSVAIFFGWFFLHALLQIAAPGKTSYGLPLADGRRLPYKMNGLFSFWFSIAVAALLVYTGILSPSVLYDQFGPLLTTVNLFTFALALYLYWLGKASPESERISGNVIYDFFMGTALNPRIGSFDLKLFCEARPGLIGWVLIDLSLAAKQYQLHHTVTVPMILVCAFHFLYVADYYFNEEAVLTTWDIKYENFGWMLCWGDLVWVPFTYTLQALYLVNHTHQLPLWGIVGIVALNLTGYLIFRRTNIQKHRFRKDPTRPVWGRQPEYITTPRGVLLVSGWWGIARHINYFGDLLMGLAWCLPTLFAHPLTYFYIVYFTILLVHRERRDNDFCHAKYGADWERYCARVRWRIIPGLY